MNRSELLETARDIVTGDRKKQYGEAEDNFRTIAKMWRSYLCAKKRPLDIDPHDVAAMMSLLKIARIASGHGKADNWIDLAGYAACGAELEAILEDAENDGAS